MAKSDELICTTEYLRLYTRFRINQCRYNRVQPYYPKMGYAVSAQRLKSRDVPMMVGWPGSSE
jgi:hypothetical protein